MAHSPFHDTDPFRVEQRGIDFVGHDERWASPRDIAAHVTLVVVWIAIGWLLR